MQWHEEAGSAPLLRHRLPRQGQGVRGSHGGHVEQDSGDSLSRVGEGSTPDPAQRPVVEEDVALLQAHDIVESLPKRQTPGVRLGHQLGEARASWGGHDESDIRGLHVHHELLFLLPQVFQERLGPLSGTHPAVHHQKLPQGRRLGAARHRVVVLVVDDPPSQNRQGVTRLLGVDDDGDTAGLPQGPQQVSAVRQEDHPVHGNRPRQHDSQIGQESLRAVGQGVANDVTVLDALPP